MKTEKLIGLLASGDVAVPANSMGQRLWRALAWGMPAAMLLMVCFYGVRGDLLQATASMMLWVKLVFAGTLAFFASVATTRLGRPGVRLGRAWMGLALPLLLLWIVAIVVFVQADPEQHVHLLMGSTAKTCSLNIAFLSVPLFVATLWFTKGLAPTSLGLAGASAGLLAGALATLVYTFHCPESGAPFVGIWYVLGILIPTGIGALIGPRFLRW